jgi:hypothetical protein
MGCDRLVVDLNQAWQVGGGGNADGKHFHPCRE